MKPSRMGRPDMEAMVPEAAMDPARYTGCSAAQVTAFLENEVQPILEQNKEILGMTADINV